MVGHDPFAVTVYLVSPHFVGNYRQNLGLICDVVTGPNTGPFEVLRLDRISKSATLEQGIRYCLKMLIPCFPQAQSVTNGTKTAQTGPDFSGLIYLPCLEN